jgi:glycosyltransferase involved in cell wall biosynthesis
MSTLHFSFIIPVYNRPDEVEELLNSFMSLEGNIPFEIVIVEDGSTILCEAVVNSYNSKLDISYYFKPNSGPGDSRNYGMQNAKGNYYIILDSDCILPKHYLQEVVKNLNEQFVDCFGGPDAAHSSFTNIQKAINFAMTSLITTGGIRGGKKQVNTFQPRSFNMGLSKEGFIASKGFGLIHPGEDPDLSIRLTKLGLETKLFSNAYVYHKRRISWSKFYKQVHKFGLVRPILNKWHPNTSKITYWFPTIFSLGLFVALISLFFNSYFLVVLYVFYFLVAFILALFNTRNLEVAFLSIFAIIIQFFGYGYGFLKSTIAINILNKNPQTYFPFLFYNK